MTFRFTTNKFEASHGRKPKGFGCWAFQLGAESTNLFFAPAGTFTEAKKAAKAEALAQGHNTAHTLG